MLVPTCRSTHDLPHSYRRSFVSADTWNEMQNRSERAESPLDRLVRDVVAFGRPNVSRLHAVERLTAELGGDLLAAVRAELDRADAGAFPLCSRPRRVA